MRISEMIKRLQEEMETHGDLKVSAFDSYSGDEYEIMGMRFMPSTPEAEALSVEREDRIWVGDVS